MEFIRILGLYINTGIDIEPQNIYLKFNGIIHKYCDCN